MIFPVRKSVMGATQLFPGAFNVWGTRYDLRPFPPEKMAGCTRRSLRIPGYRGRQLGHKSKVWGSRVSRQRMEPTYNPIHDNLSCDCPCKMTLVTPAQSFLQVVKAAWPFWGLRLLKSHFGFQTAADLAPALAKEESKNFLKWQNALIASMPSSLES